MTHRLFWNRFRFVHIYFRMAKTRTPPDAVHETRPDPKPTELHYYDRKQAFQARRTMLQRQLKAFVEATDADMIFMCISPHTRRVDIYVTPNMSSLSSSTSELVRFATNATRRQPKTPETTPALTVQ